MSPLQPEGHKGGKGQRDKNNSVRGRQHRKPNVVPNELTALEATLKRVDEFVVRCQSTEPTNAHNQYTTHTPTRTMDTTTPNTNENPQAAKPSRKTNVSSGTMPTPLGVKRKNQQEFFGPHDPELDSVPTPYAPPQPLLERLAQPPMPYRARRRG